MNRTHRSTTRSAPLFAALLVAFAAALAAPTRAAAQTDETEVAPSDGGGDYAWGEGGSTNAAPSADDPMRIMGFLGAGAGFRLLRNLDPPFQQEFLVPAYLDVGGALYLEGGDVRHGPSFYVSTLLMDDAAASGIGAGQQWVLTPGYSLLLPLQRLAGMEQDLLQIQARVGIPIVFGPALGTGSGADVAVGVELGLALHIKFLAGLGVYVEGQAAVYGGSLDTVHPTITFDAGLLIDYELLP